MAESEFPGVRALLETSSMRQFAFIAGMSPMTARKIALRNLDANIPNEDGLVREYKTRGADGKLRPARRYDTLIRDAKIVAMRQAGASIRAIAQTCDCSVGTVHRVLKAYAG